MSGYPNTLKYFMWPYQVHFRISCQVSAEGVFQALDRGLEPNVYLIGFANEQSTDRPNVCFEPEYIDILGDNFSKIDRYQKEFIENDPRRNMFYTGEGMQEEMNMRLIKKGFRKGLEKVLNESDQFDNKIHFSSDEYSIGEYRVFIVLQLNKEVYQSHVHLKKTLTENDLQIYTSLVDSAISTYLAEMQREIYAPNPGRNLSNNSRTGEDMLRAAAKSFMYTVSSKGMDFEGLHGLFDSCNNISISKYEGQENRGHLIIAKKDDANIEMVLELEAPFELRDTRKTRKMLQLSSALTGVVCNSNLVLGLGKIRDTYKIEDESVFNVKFKGVHCWDVYHCEKNILQMRYGLPEVQKETVSKKKFESDIKRLFPEITSAQIANLYKLTIASTSQKNGALLIFSKSASSEAQRLSRQCIQIKPVKLTEELILDLTAIDGGLLVDVEGIAYAQGVILDGIVGSKGDSARGSRYNSALTYFEFKGLETPTLLVVVSEDGMVDIIPDLMPQISHSEIVQVIKILDEINSNPEIDTGTYNKVMSWFRARQFYLTPEECMKINQVKSEIDAKLKGLSMRIIHQDVEPNPEMNSSYYLQEEQRT